MMTEFRQIRDTRSALPVLRLVIAGFLLLPVAVAVAGDFDARPTHRTVLAQNSFATISPTQFEAEASKNHETLAKYYEDSAAEMRAKADEHKLLLEQYEDKSYLYGKKAQDLQSHAAALIRKYEHSAEADAKKADTHRQIASRLKENSDRESRLSTANASRR
jgi:hypothetical protein